MAELKSPIDIATYLFTRLKELGVDSIHGVPGDYNLVALDYINEIGLKWVGNCNELNAGYAADGYARVKGISAIVTTFGVGELSAMNALAGAYSEKVPIVHIVGTPSTISQKNGMMLHHTLGNGNFNVFSDMNKEISCAVAKISSPSEAAAQIDDVLRQCWIKSQPVYITLPTDMVKKKVEGERLKTPIDLSSTKNEEAREDYVVDVVLKYLHAAKNPAILLDACTIRHRVVSQVNDLAEKTGLPVFVTPMGKGAIDETNPNYAGVYAGEGSQPDVRERLESSDLILSIGAVKSDFNTGGFTYKTSQLNTIDFHSTHITVRYSEYPNVHMRGVLEKVTQKVDLKQLSALPGPKVSNAVQENHDSSPTITQAWFWPRIGEFLKNKDIVVTETGTSNFGIWETKFPPGVTAISQVLWGSIGYSVGACQGAALAARDAGSDRRTILFVGDGSFQLTAQEISTMIRLGLNPIIFCICNKGYTIERFIHGMNANYNDVQEWKYKDVLQTFGAKEGTTKSYQVHTKSDIDALLKDKDFNDAQKLQFVEVHMKWDDAPRALKIAAEASAKNNDKV